MWAVVADPSVMAGSRGLNVAGDGKEDDKVCTYLLYHTLHHSSLFPSYNERASPSRASTISFLRRVISQYTSCTEKLKRIMNLMYDIQSDILKIHT
jgi:hypothetical protein